MQQETDRRRLSLPARNSDIRDLQQQIDQLKKKMAEQTQRKERDEQSK